MVGGRGVVPRCPGERRCVKEWNGRKKDPIPDGPLKLQLLRTEAVILTHASRTATMAASKTYPMRRREDFNPSIYFMGLLQWSLI